MRTQTDPLSKPQTPDRVYFANGALLDQEDFTAEQIYHRGRIGRALAYLNGHGTVAGLEVTVQQQDEEDMLMVSAGLALAIAVFTLASMLGSELCGWLRTICTWSAPIKSTLSTKQDGSPLKPPNTYRK